MEAPLKMLPFAFHETENLGYGMSTPATDLEPLVTEIFGSFGLGIVIFIEENADLILPIIPRTVDLADSIGFVIADLTWLNFD
jgi:hypothetical protein